MSGRPGTTGLVFRHVLRTLAVVALALGLAGASNLGAHVDSESQGGASTQAYQIETMKLQRLVDANERADRSRRTSSGAEAQEQVRRAVEAQVKPTPEPSPTPEPAPAPESAPAPSTAVGPVPDSCGDYSGNRATGCAMLLDAGFSIDQMSCLDNLWTSESGWNHRAQNPSSGAYGIPQSLPGDKMATHGSDWRTNPATQISWGLSYISNRYGTPCGAWGFFQANNWY